MVAVSSGRFRHGVQARYAKWKARVAQGLGSQFIRQLAHRLSYSYFDVTALIKRTQLLIEVASTLEISHANTCIRSDLMLVQKATARREMGCD